MARGRVARRRHLRLGGTWSRRRGGRTLTAVRPLGEAPVRRHSTRVAQRASVSRRNVAASSGAAVRAGRSTAERRRTGRRPARLTFTTRAALLALTLCAVGLTLAYPAREYFSQRQQISSLSSQLSQERRQVADLSQSSRALNDPAVIEQQARLRLHMQRPGDQVYVVPPAPPPPEKTQQAGSVRTPELPGRDRLPWYSQLWRSVDQTSR